MRVDDRDREYVLGQFILRASKEGNKVRKTILDIHVGRMSRGIFDLPEDVINSCFSGEEYDGIRKCVLTALRKVNPK